MICKIADIGVKIPAIGNLPERCKKYLDETVDPEIDLTFPQMSADVWKELTPNTNYYLMSGFRFNQQLLKYDGLMLHASAVVVDGKAYLFSGPSGMGKSTHTAKYIETFPNAIIINDDEPSIRCIDGIWYAFGTPWCGKTGNNTNLSAPIAGICFLKRGDNTIRHLKAEEAIPLILQQTLSAENPEWDFLWDLTWNDLLMKNIKRLVEEVPFFEFYNHADNGVEIITYNAINNKY